MSKKVKIKEVESKVKIIREVSNEEIEDITKGEPRMHSDEGVSMNLGGGIKVSPVLRSDERGNEIWAAARSSVAQASPRSSEQERSGVQLYAAGRGFGNESAGQRANYRQARQAQADQRFIGTSA
ncbi:MAG: hypothetical protein KC506_01105, partial [Nanoarchaeota archaeon]|nr:hypothetical protein [Nanoarchaeota archaeon]